MAIAGSDICGQQAESIEWRFMAVLWLFGHIAADYLHRDMAGAFNHHLYIVLTGYCGQFNQGVQLSEFRFIVGVLNRA